MSASRRCQRMVCHRLPCHGATLPTYPKMLAGGAIPVRRLPSSSMSRRNLADLSQSVWTVLQEGSKQKRRACKPGSVPWAPAAPTVLRRASSARRYFADAVTPTRCAPSIWAGRYRPAPAAYPQAGVRLLDGPSTCCAALLLARFTMPPPSPATRWALTPPFHPHRQAPGAAARRRQYVFCGTLCPRRPRATRPGRYPAPCPCGARTFLHRCGPEGPSGSGAPARLSISLRSRCYSSVDLSGRVSSIAPSSPSSGSSLSAGSSSNIRSSSSNSALEASKASPSNSSSPP